MKWIRWLRVIKRHQRLGFVQSFDRDRKAHVCKDPANEKSTPRMPYPLLQGTFFFDLPTLDVYDGSPNVIVPFSIAVMHASDSTGTPSDFKASRPPSKIFSISVPMPTIFEPAASARRARPRIVCPLARKSSMISTRSPFARYSGE